MGLVKAITVLADHKGITTPRVSGDEYFVDAIADISEVVATGSIIPASDFGLKTITAAMITGHDNANGVQPQIECSATGAYESASSIALMFTALDGTNNTLANDADGGTVRLRVYGNI